MHSSNPTCSACHNRIDPIGFSLENFDYFGRWRDTYHFRERVETEEEADEIRVVEDTNVFTERRFYRNTYTPIQAAGSLPSGTVFDGPAGLKRTLLNERHDDLVRQTASKMLAYAPRPPARVLRRAGPAGDSSRHWRRTTTGSRRW